MSLKEREQALLDYLRTKKSASVLEMCSVLYVSEPTMRRDLAVLHKRGKLIRTHGGAVYREEPGVNIPLSFREREHSGEKQIIARKCLSLIEEGNTVMLDGSSSALALLRLLDPAQRLIVVTNSAKAAILLAEKKIKTFVTGGRLQPDSYAYTGSYTERFLGDFHADICFFSVRTLTPEGELTDNAIDENHVRRVMLEQSQKRVLMLDSQKISKACPHTLCTLRDVDHVVCERDVSDIFGAFSDKFL